MDTEPGRHAGGRPTVRIERVLDAPPEVVWAMWAESEHFAAWYGPTGALVEVREFDLSVGGRRDVQMTVDTPSGPMQMRFVGEHREIDPPHRLVYSETLVDDDGAARSEHTEVVVELAAEGTGTRLTLLHIGVPPGSPGEAGWNMALDGLADRLTR